jgi:hypothetical protein
VEITATLNVKFWVLVAGGGGGELHLIEPNIFLRIYLNLREKNRIYPKEIKSQRGAGRFKYWIYTKRIYSYCT